MCSFVKQTWSVSLVLLKVWGLKKKKVAFQFYFSSPGITLSVLSVHRENALRKWPWVELKEVVGNIYKSDFRFRQRAVAHTVLLDRAGACTFIEISQWQLLQNFRKGYNLYVLKSWTDKSEFWSKWRADEDIDLGGHRPIAGRKKHKNWKHPYTLTITYYYTLCFFSFTKGKLRGGKSTQKKEKASTLIMHVCAYLYVHSLWHLQTGIQWQKKEERGKQISVSMEGYLSKEVFGSCDFQQPYLFVVCSLALHTGYWNTFKVSLFGFKDKAEEQLLLWDGRSSRKCSW